ncbi:MAG: S9 family peptidase [Bacteroidetes bacterium]|nr:S9 family peptidase [Bacteroidota bacterium]
MKKLLFIVSVCISCSALAQNKKPLDHTVYDGWQSIGEKLISNDGAWVVYTINPQEGDGELVIQNPMNNYKKTVARGYNAVITDDSKYVIFKIKPLYQETRQAKIKKKSPDEMPKDSLGMITLGQDSVYKIAKVKSYKTPEKAAGWMAYLLDKMEPAAQKTKAQPDSATQINNMLKMADSLVKIADSLRNKTKEVQTKGMAILKPEKKETKPVSAKANAEKVEEGTELVLRNLTDGTDKKFKLVTEYYFSKKGNTLLVETSAKNNDSITKATVLWVDLFSGKVDTVMKKFNDAKNYAFDEEGNQLAFVAERDSVSKALTKFYKLWYYHHGADSASMLADKNTVGMKVGNTISENANIIFSKDAKKLFFGTAPIKAPKDTSLIDFELARLDVWHYKDDYLQPQQLRQLDNELKRSYTAVINLGHEKVVQLGAEDAERITLVNEGNANWVLAESNKGNRVEGQWTGRTKFSAYVISTEDGTRKTVQLNSLANYNPSPAGKFVYWYDDVKKNYFTYNVATGVIKNVTQKIKLPLYDEENDVPDYPSPYGVMGWSKDDNDFYVYDRYEVWDVKPNADAVAVTAIDPAKAPRKNKVTYRYINTDREERYINTDKPMLFRIFDNNTKMSALDIATIKNNQWTFTAATEKYGKGFPVKAKNALAFIYTKENYVNAPNLYYDTRQGAVQQLSEINMQQQNYNWGTAELFKWKAYNGKESEGIIYKPENFDPKKKYPMISYFYEKLSDGLYTYQPPSPTPSRLNIPFFVSRGYVVFVPDISYTTGHPGQDAYNYIVSGVRAVVKLGYVDSTKLGLQGQSWGGYQTAILITKTKLFAAAWAGAPVANMTSAYGGIRWGSGLNRQFQYEKTQSRIGATLWEKQNLYIENSPLFHLPNVNTPLVIMSNDADDAVPWYQGIELFTAMRRLSKPVWLLQYNNEAHNLVERKNRKDIQIREQQFFDWKLKGDKPAQWLIDGVPATEKGIDWGLKVE